MSQLLRHAVLGLLLFGSGCNCGTTPGADGGTGGGTAGGGVGGGSVGGGGGSLGGGGGSLGGGGGSLGGGGGSVGGGGGSTGGGGGAASDAGMDAGQPADAGMDAGQPTDAGMDAGQPTDAGMDAGQATDAGLDAGVDAGTTCCGTTATWAATEARLPSADCPAWTLLDTANQDNPVLADGGVTLRTRANAENLTFTMTAPDLAAGNLVNLRFRMQYVSGSANAAWRTGAGVHFAFGPTRTKNSLYIGNGEIFLLSAENTRGAAATLATADTFHDYEIEVNRGTGAVRVLRDGTQALTGSLFITATDTTTDYIAFGEASSEATGESSWASFEHTAWAGCGVDVAWAATESRLPSNDCPAWALTDSAPSVDPVLGATGVTLTTQANAENQFFGMTSQVIQPGAQVQLRFRTRLVSNSAAGAPWRAGTGVFFAFGPTRTKNSLFIGNGEIFLLSAENMRGMAATVTTTGFHDYVIDVNTGTGAISVKYDGVPTLTGSLFITTTDTTTDYVYWGDASSFAFGQSEWASFSHDAYLFCAP